MKMWNAADEAKYKVQGLMLNLDNTAHHVAGITSDEQIIAWANQFKGTHVTDIVMNIAESASVFPSRFGWYGEKYLQKEEWDGEKMVPVSYGGFAKYLYEHYNVYHLDYIKTLSEELPKAGINMWVSVRMNDAHDRPTKKTSILYTNFYHDHPEYRRGNYPTKLDTAKNKILDYAIPEVREHYLDLIDETLERYDVYGFQLEWQRNIFLWKIGDEYINTEILDQFMRDAKAIITKHEKRYGHKIKLSVQVAHSLETNYAFGLDVMKWVREGLVDMVVPKSHLHSISTETPIRLWKSLTEPYGVELVPDVEYNNSCTPEVVWVPNDFETYAGIVALFLSQGADKIQLYNILPNMHHIFKDEDKIGEYNKNIFVPIVNEEGVTSVPAWWLMFTSMGSLDKLMTMNRKVVASYSDTKPLWAVSDAVLPRTIQTDDSVFMIRLGMGNVPEGASVKVKFAADVVDADNPPVVYVNSQYCPFIGVKNQRTRFARQISFTAMKFPRVHMAKCTLLQKYRAPTSKAQTK